MDVIGIRNKLLLCYLEFQLIYYISVLWPILTYITSNQMHPNCKRPQGKWLCLPGLVEIFPTEESIMNVSNLVQLGLLTTPRKDEDMVSESISPKLTQF